MCRSARLLCCLLLAAPSLALAQGDERAAIAQERRRLEGAFAAEQAACATRFAVNACIEDVAERRRAALAPLRERELAIDDAERRARAARQREAAARQRAAASSAAGPASAAAARPRPSARAASGPTAPRSAPDPALRASEAARRAAAAERRAAEARKVQERIERREAERARAGKVAQPLPVPASGAGG